jgi:hypothetical protein
MITSKTMVKDRGWSKLKRNDVNLKGAHVKVGVIGGSNTISSNTEGNSETPIIEYAIYNEYGTNDGVVPSRPFMRQSFDENKNKLRSIAASSYKNSGTNSTELIKKVLAQIGVLHQSQVQDKIVDIKTPPNAPSTVASKGSSNPLIDSGDLKKSISHNVEMS